jgi:hypothetical protein
MLIFNLTVHHLWGRVLAKFPEARAIAYADDGYIKAKLSIALQVLAELKAVFKAHAGLELNVSKTSILPKGTTAQAAFDREGGRERPKPGVWGCVQCSSIVIARPNVQVLTRVERCYIFHTLIYSTQPTRNSIFFLLHI